MAICFGDKIGDKIMKRYIIAILALLASLVIGVVVARAGTLFFDDFTGSSPGWSWSTGNGGTVDFNYGGTLLLSNNGGTGNCCSPEFPLVGRNDAFSNINSYWRLSIRFRYPEVTAYGTNISAGTGTFDANSRQDQSQPVRADWGNILGIHQVAQPVCKFDVSAFGTLHYSADNGCSGDLNWHTVELEVNGGSYCGWTAARLGPGRPAGLQNACGLATTSYSRTGATGPIFRWIG